MTKDKIYAQEKYRANFQEDKTTKLIIATAEIESIGSQEPYFAITGEIYNPHIRQESGLESCGCLHDDIVKHFPQLQKYVKWHLTSTKGPMHYIPNSLYWAGFLGWCNGGHDDPPNYKYLKSTCIYGALPEDEQTDITKLDKTQLQSWLENRLDKLMLTWKADMIELFGDIFSE